MRSVFFMKKTNMRKLSSILSVLFLASLSSTSYAMKNGSSNKPESSISAGNEVSPTPSKWTKWVDKVKTFVGQSKDIQKSEEKKGDDYVGKDGLIVYKKDLFNFLGKAQGDSTVKNTNLSLQAAYLEGYFGFDKNYKRYSSARYNRDSKETVVARQVRERQGELIPVDSLDFWELGANDRKENKKLRLPLKDIMDSRDIKLVLFRIIYAQIEADVRAEFEKKAKECINIGKTYYDDKDVSHETLRRTNERFIKYFGKEDGTKLYSDGFAMWSENPVLAGFKKAVRVTSDATVDLGKAAMKSAFSNPKEAACMFLILGLGSKLFF